MIQYKSSAFGDTTAKEYNDISAIFSKVGTYSGFIEALNFCKDGANTPLDGPLTLGSSFNSICDALQRVVAKEKINTEKLTEIQEISKKAVETIGLWSQAPEAASVYWLKIINLCTGLKDGRRADVIIPNTKLDAHEDFKEALLKIPDHPARE